MLPHELGKGVLTCAPSVSSSCASRLSVQGRASFVQLATTVALLGGCGVASWTLYQISRRYIGELALLPGATAGSLDSSRMLMSTPRLLGQPPGALEKVLTVLERRCMM